MITTMLKQSPSRIQSIVLSNSKNPFYYMRWGALHCPLPQKYGYVSDSPRLDFLEISPFIIFFSLSPQFLSLLFLLPEMVHSP